MKWKVDFFFSNGRMHARICMQSWDQGKYRHALITVTSLSKLAQRPDKRDAARSPLIPKEQQVSSSQMGIICVKQEQFVLEVSPDHRHVCICTWLIKSHQIHSLQHFYTHQQLFHRTVQPRQKNVIFIFTFNFYVFCLFVFVFCCLLRGYMIK